MVHEIRAFESNAKERGYSTEAIIIARYVLCAMLDESIIYGKIKKRSVWQRYKLINAFQKEQSADERFFLILERLLMASDTHIDLLELIYTALSLGYEGKYRHDRNGMKALSEVTDHLYQNIRALRGDVQRLPLADTDKLVSLEPQANNLKPLCKKAILKALIAVVLGSSLIYGSLTFMYQKISMPLAQQVNMLSKLQNTG